MYTEEQQWLVSRIQHDPETDCWLWTKVIDRYGYGRIGRCALWRKYNIRNEQAHWLSFLLFKGTIPDGLIVRHKCRNRHCCNPKHLELGTKKDNSDDKYRDGTNNRARNQGWGKDGTLNSNGFNNRSAKLSDEQVLEIRRLRATGNYTLRQLGEMYDVSLSMIGYIVNRKYWTHL